MRGRVPQPPSQPEHRREPSAQRRAPHPSAGAYPAAALPRSDAEMNDDVLLSAKDLGVRFGGVVAVNNVSFDVKRGEVFTLIGPNGAGKTTVFNLISRIYAPTAGAIAFEGES